MTLLSEVGFRNTDSSGVLGEVLEILAIGIITKFFSSEFGTSFLSSQDAISSANSERAVSIVLYPLDRIGVCAFGAERAVDELLLSISYSVILLQPSLGGTESRVHS